MQSLQIKWWIRLRPRYCRQLKSGGRPVVHPHLRRDWMRLQRKIAIQEVSQERARESKSLIEKAKSLQKEGVIVDVPREMEQEAAAVKEEPVGSQSSSS
eukprot:4772327-Karenia_brevis.AAC.1